MDMTADTVLDIFKDITRIPRESGHEGPMTAFLQEFAAKRSLECRTDKTGNVVIVKEAAPGKENVPILVLQAHQDMVCEKNAHFDFDFLTQAIPYEVEDGWMVAKNTTLGAHRHRRLPRPPGQRPPHRETRVPVHDFRGNRHGRCLCPGARLL